MQTTLFFVTFIIIMGFFNNLYGQGKVSPNVSHSEDWDFYITTVDDKPASIALDLGLFDVAPITGKENVVWISIKMNNPRNDGLPSNEESDSLADIENKMVQFLSNTAIYVGRLSSNGYRDLYFYSGDSLACKKSVSQAMDNHPQYIYEVEAKVDRNWDGYFKFLYPSPAELQSISNKKVLYNLEKNGDRLTKSREVEHWIYFKTQADRESFLSRIANDGYRVIAKEKNKTYREFPYQLHISRLDKVDYGSVDEYIIPLWQKAQECNGVYDGWETAVVKE